MRSSLASGKSATPPARCILRPQRDTSSAEYRLLVSRASVGASREPESCRSPALIPNTCAVCPTFRYGAFLFVAFALAALSSARLTTPGGQSVTPRGTLSRPLQHLDHHLEESVTRTIRILPLAAITDEYGQFTLPDPEHSSQIFSIDLVPLPPHS